MKQSVSAIIPTLGRPSLRKAVESALTQTHPIDEIIVVDGSADGIDMALLPESSCIRVVRSREHKTADLKGQWTAAMNRNIGVRASTTEWVAFLDDDDQWIPNKTEAQLSLPRNSDDIALTCRVRHLRASGLLKQRRRGHVNTNVSWLSNLYGHPHWLPLRPYIATPTLMVRRQTALQIPFPEALLGFEDTWWIHLLELNGVTLKMHPDVLVQVNAQPMRSIARDSPVKNRAWADVLSTADPVYARNFLLGIAARNAALLGRRSDVEAMIAAAQAYSPVAKRHLAFARLMLLIAGISRQIRQGEAYR